MKNYWYEVFKSSEDGTYTLAICETLKEARKRKKNFERLYSEVHIDKWKLKKDRTNQKIKEVE